MKRVNNISSRENPIYRFIKSLHQKKVRERNGFFLIEGKRLVDEALNLGVKIEYIIFNESLEYLPKVNPDCRILKLKNNLFKELSNTVNSQGIIAVVGFLDATLSKVIMDVNPFIIVLNSIQDPGNVGTIIRTAAAVKATAVFLTKGTVELYNSKVIRSTMGALFQIPIVRHFEDDRAVKWLNEHEIDIIVADLEGKVDYYSADLNKPLALVIGNENNGPDDVWKNAAYEKVKIPIPGITESLNASVAAGILIYDVLRQRKG